MSEITQSPELVKDITGAFDYCLGDGDIPGEHAAFLTPERLIELIKNDATREIRIQHLQHDRLAPPVSGLLITEGEPAKWFVISPPRSPEGVTYRAQLTACDHTIEAFRKALPL